MYKESVLVYTCVLYKDYAPGKHSKMNSQLRRGNEVHVGDYHHTHHHKDGIHIKGIYEAKLSFNFFLFNLRSKKISAELRHKDGIHIKGIYEAKLSFNL